MRALGALASGPIYFIPSNEWYNADQVKWVGEIGVKLFNFSPGSGSNRGYLAKSDPKFLSLQGYSSAFLRMRTRIRRG
jgi:hypothetical protein